MSTPCGTSDQAHQTLPFPLPVPALELIIPRVGPIPAPVWEWIRAAPASSVPGDAAEAGPDSLGSSAVVESIARMTFDSAPALQNHSSRLHTAAQPRKAKKQATDTKQTDYDAYIVAVVDLAKRYPFSVRSIELAFDPALPRSVRKCLHDCAHTMGIVSVSRGQGDFRRLTFYNPMLLVDYESKVVYERFVDRGYVSFEGPLVNWVGSLPHPKVGEALRRARATRDGEDFHITVLNRHEVESVDAGPAGLAGNSVAFVMQRLKQFLEDGKLVDDWTDLGMGRASDRPDNEVYFRVVEWPALNLFRHTLGLASSHFHITVGFSKYDVHDGVAKDSSSLLGSLPYQLPPSETSVV